MTDQIIYGDDFRTLARKYKDMGDGTYAEVVFGSGVAFNVQAYGAKGDGTTDDTVSIQAALTAAGVKGGAVILPPGNYLITATLTIPSGVTLEGTSFAGVQTSVGVADLGSVIKTSTALDPMVSSIDTKGIAIRDLVLDGTGVAVTGAKIGVFQGRIEGCEFKRFTTRALNLVPGATFTTHECWVKNNLITMNGVGTGILITGVSGSFQCHDNQFIGNVIRGAVVCGIDDDRSGGNLIQANHIYDFPANPINMLVGVRVTGSGNNSILDNYLDNIAGGPSIRIVGSTDTTKKCRSHLIAGNTFYTSAVMTDNTYNAIELDDATIANSIWDIGIRNNAFNADDTSGNRWANAVKITGTVPGVSLEGNSVYGAVKLFTGTRPAILKSNIRYTANFGASSLFTENAGSITVTGDAVTQTFSTAHGIDGTPRLATFAATNAAARNLGTGIMVGYNGTNFVMTFQAAPAVNTYTYNWYAEL